MVASLKLIQGTNNEGISESPPRTVGPYRLEALIGSGGMGEVYRAYDRRLERRVAIKHIHPDKEPDANARRRLRREAKAAAALAHPAIVQVFDILEEDDGEWIVMELVEGSSLARQLEAGPLQVDVAVKLAREAADGLAYAHDQGFIHRDLKTENVMISPLGHAKILDFGLAKRLARDEESLTQSGSVVGTSRAMSPEQAQGYPVDTRSDLFSLGVLIYECLTNRSPFKADSAVATLTRVCTHRQKPMRDLNPAVPEDLTRLVDRLLEKLPEMRPPDARHVAEKLASIGRRLERTASITQGMPAAESETIDFRASEEAPRDDQLPAAAGWDRGARSLTWKKLLQAAPLAFLLVVIVPSVVLPEIRKLLLDWLMNPSDPIAGPLATSPASPAQQLQPRGVSESDPLRIVVLPFESLGPGDNAYFAAGIAEEISRRLTTLSGLGVISRTSAARYADAGLSVGEIGRALDVAYVLEGTVSWPPEVSDDSPQEIRVTPRLIRVSDDIQIWTTAYERLLDDFLGLQAEIASEVASRLDLSLRQTERRAFEARGTEIPAAYFAYLRGLDYRAQPQFSNAGLQKAARMFEHATRQDPNFTEAYVELARVQSHLYFNNDPSQSRRQSAEAALQRAQALDSNLPAVRIASAYYRYHVERDYGAALREFSAVARQLPYNAEILAGLGLVKRRQGEFRESVELLSQSFSLDMANANLARDISEIYRGARDFKAADQWQLVALELAPDFALALGERALNALAWKGCPPEVQTAAGCSTDMARRILNNSPIADDPELYRFWLALDFYDATIAAGDEARQWLTHIIDRFASTPVRPDEPQGGCLFFWHEALAFERLGQPQQARNLVENCRTETARVLALKPNANAYLARLGIAHAYLGNREEAIALGEQAVEQDAEDRFRSPEFREHLAVSLVFLGELDQAVEILEQQMAIPYKDALTRAELLLDPVWEPLRDLSSFRDLVSG